MKDAVFSHWLIGIALVLGLLNPVMAHESSMKGAIHFQGSIIEVACQPNIQIEKKAVVVSSCGLKSAQHIPIKVVGMNDALAVVNQLNAQRGRVEASLHRLSSLQDDGVERVKFAFRFL